MQKETPSGAPRKRKSSGFDHLRSGLGTLSPAARHEVFQLLGPALVAKKKMKMTNGKESMETNEAKSKIQRQIVTASMSENETLSMVAASEISLLGSICFMFDEVNTSNHNDSSPIRRNAMEILKQCGFAVDPQRSPGQFDARSMVLAALFFLCETSYLKSVSKVTSAKASADLSKRLYEKGYDWKWDDVKHKVTGELEDAFYDDDPRHYEFLSRQRFLPAPSFFAGSKNDHFQMLLRGVVPAPVRKVASKNVPSTQSSKDADLP